MAYKLEGRLLEVCNCNIACPCWLGEDPDFGECYSAEGYHIDTGVVDGVDVSGLRWVSSPTSPVIFWPGTIALCSSWMTEPRLRRKRRC